ncbi:ABC transporter permease [Actinomadura oligospora]|uniref:ABC transporter permease n=1 Tax=Actinomadura oligospora TaxID=111804 RepID=UPI0004AC88B4|nr:ABC transporter permease [Actinomadura oligospora]
MSTGTKAGRPADAGSLRPYRVTDALRSEWLKIRTLRSTAYTLLVTVGLGVGLGLLFTAAGAAGYETGGADDHASFDPTATSLKSHILAQLALGQLGVLVVTSEYATGMIRTSLTSVPRRTRLLASKAAAFSAVALATGQLVGFTTFLAGQPVLAARHVPHAGLGDPHVFRAVFGCGLYLAVIGLLGVALGALIRSTAGALAALVTATLLIPVISTALPTRWADVAHRWWPSDAGGQIMAVRQDPEALGPWAGFGVLCLAVGMVLALAVAVFRERDA